MQAFGKVVVDDCKVEGCLRVRLVETVSASCGASRGVEVVCMGGVATGHPSCWNR